MAATVVTHMIISLTNHIGRAPNTNASYKKVATIQQYENVSEIKYHSAIEPDQSPPSGAQEYQYDLVEPAISVGAGTIVKVKNAVRTISEPAKTISESFARKVTHLIAEPAKTITEGLVKSKTANRPISEPASSIGESLAKIVHRIRTINEPATTIDESLVSSKNYNRTISESAISITDSLTKHAIKARGITESPTNITEALTHIRLAELTETPISVSESLQASKTLRRSLSENVFVSGVEPPSFPSISFSTASFTTSVSSTENLIKKVTHNLAQTVSITENLLKVRQVVRTFSETVPLQPEIIQRLVTHYLNEPTISITESLAAIKNIQRSIIETPISITELLTARREFKRSINPISFTTESFTTGAFESFNTPLGDVTEISEELEGFVLPYWQKVLIEPATDITEDLQTTRQFIRVLDEPSITIGESLTAVKSLAPPISVGGRSRRRRRAIPRFPLFRQPTKIPPVKEPEHEPFLFEVELSESPIAITESLSALKITREKIPFPVISQAASTPPQIIEKIVYVDKIVEKEILIQPPPLIKAQDIIVSKPKPIEVEQELLVSTQDYSDRRKSKAASVKLEILQQLAMLSEMESLI